MMNNVSLLGESHNRENLSPIISAHTIIDPDTGLFKFMMQENYINPEVFNYDFFTSRTESEVVSELHYREEKNPLYLIAKDRSNDTLLDEYYNQFLETKYEEILEASNSTEIVDFIYAMLSDGKIKPTILYYKEEEMNQLLIFDNFIDIEMITIDELLSNTDKYGQYFLKYFEEIEPVIDYIGQSTIYVSDNGLNFDDKGIVRRKDIASKLADQFNDINVFNMYNPKIVNREKIRRE